MRPSPDDDKHFCFVFVSVWLFKFTLISNGKILLEGFRYPLGTIGTVPRARDIEQKKGIRNLKMRMSIYNKLTSCYQRQSCMTNWHIYNFI